jgi:hypothetical protein
MEIGDLVQLHHIEFEFKGVAPHDIGVIVAIDQTGPHHPWPKYTVEFAMALKTIDVSGWILRPA